MAITLGTFTKLDDASLTGTFQTLNSSTSLTIVPVQKLSEHAPDHRIYAGNGRRYEVGAGWSQVAKTSGETYLNLKIGAPEFGPNWVRARLVKLETPGEDGITHMALWEPRDR
ncbi:hypothetical protein AZA_87079 [Nitrospirillum viridazoti Y2]|uniref:Uncharacterized protein (DUF736 family) n=1 Tax=Nitrospirillum amazonense TaxID=28077 RepID=A0A560HKE4_9PROT|nr:DUF736 domain-containing protein [Nitrospirillum amazonense]EGY02469.1 hypothetical protein AZA_87079 [Nitrospirillum amazonense Y2]TWB46978.1 uncharacterized protein (DUF736 family) [Nitrospirillum amazonense]